MVDKKVPVRYLDRCMDLLDRAYGYSDGGAPEGHRNILMDDINLLKENVTVSGLATYTDYIRPSIHYSETLLRKTRPSYTPRGDT
jgi:hypothetical protein